jgi:hypothetical protein
MSTNDNEFESHPVHPAILSNNDLRHVSLAVLSIGKLSGYSRGESNLVQSLYTFFATS